jgi:nicotinamidase/pyrazinamidase
MGDLMTRYGPATALIVVDMQNDFALPEGSLYVRDGESLAPLINAEIERATTAGSPVFYTQDWHPAVTPHFADFGGSWPPHCIQGTYGAGLVVDLDVVGQVVRKGAHGEDGYSGFTQRDAETGATVPTELDALLQAAGITAVVVVGLALDVCVKQTALDAVTNGYAVTVPTDLSRPVELSPGDGARAVAEMAAAGASAE